MFIIMIFIMNIIMIITIIIIIIIFIIMEVGPRLSTVPFFGILTSSGLLTFFRNINAFPDH